MTWRIYQRMIAAYRHPKRAKGRVVMAKLINSISHGIPAALSELVTLGRTLNKRADDVLAYFERPGTSNGPTEAINWRLEHFRGLALGFRNLANYIARSLLESGGFTTSCTLDWSNWWWPKSATLMRHLRLTYEGRRAELDHQVFDRLAAFLPDGGPADLPSEYQPTSE